MEQCVRALKDISQLKEIVFYEKDEQKASELVSGINKIDDNKSHKEDIFISYSSAQRDIADEIRNKLEKVGIHCWMAPYSIPPGSSYQAEIPDALGNIQCVLLILSEEAEQSRWVQKEIGCTIGARHTLIPYKCSEYQPSSQFMFLLDGEQIFEQNISLDKETQLKELIIYLQNRLHNISNEVSRDNNEHIFLDSNQKVFNARYKYVKLIKDNWFKISIIGIGITIILELLVIIKK